MCITAKLYMRHAENDLIVAETMSGDSEAHTGARAFHSQQAAEKAIKAALVMSGAEPEWIHDLTSLARELPAEWGTGATDSDLDRLSRYVMTARYGGAAVTKDGADRALDIATAVMNAMRPKVYS